MRVTSCSASFPRALKQQRGVVLLIALIVLVAMTLAGIGLMRSVTTGSLIAGNLAFKQSAVNAADPAIEAAFTWLQSQAGTANLSNNDPARGYVSSQAIPVWTDTTAWQNAFPTNPVADAAGNRVRVLIHRMCALQNTAWNGTNQGCATESTTGTATGGSKSVGAFQYNTPPNIYYRITARVEGPRNTISFIQAIVTGPR